MPANILRELESYIIEFVWNGKKHEVNKELLCASPENGGLGLTKITNKILSQRIVWLSKLYNMEQNCFAKVIAEELLGNFDAEYKGLDFLNPISTGGGGVFSTPCPVNGSELHNGTS